MIRKLHARSLLIALAAVMLLAPIGSASSLPLPPAASVDTITPGEMRMHLEFLASPELGGRYTLSPGLNIAARYLASRLESYGYKGGASDGSFLQHFDVQTLKVDADKTSLELTVDGKTERIAYGDFATGSNSDADVSGQIVFAGYGISAPELGHDDYAGLDVKGKIALVVSGQPSNVDSSKVGEQNQAEGAAKAHGAVALLALPPARYAQFFKMPAAKEYILHREDVQLKTGSGYELPTATLKPDTADMLLAKIGLTSDKVYEIAGKGGELAPKPVGATARLAVAVQSETETSQNVVGILEGTDPALRDQYVALSAHYDHLKTNSKGQIYPGADDDGSGTAAVLTLAHAFSIERPKRSILVIFHAGEEVGLLGSEYNTDVAPAVPLDKIVVDLNIDMIGRSRPAGDTDPRNKELTAADGIYLIGADKISAELNRISERTNADTVKLKLDYTYNDPNHPQRFYYRSDHWNYAKHGIPVIFYFSGVHADYHQPTDTVDKIDFEKMARVSRLVFATGWRIANLDHRLAHDAK